MTQEERKIYGRQERKCDVIVIDNIAQRADSGGSLLMRA